MGNVPGEEDAMDSLLYIIRDELPKVAVKELHKIVRKINRVKSITDMKAFLVIEFFNKTDADAAKSEGFEVTINSATQKFEFATSGVVQVYMTSACETIGTGY